MILLLICSYSTFEETENKKKDEILKLEQILYKLSNLSMVREKLNDLLLNQSDSKIKTRTEKPVPLSLVSINSTRTNQYSNFQMPFQLFRKKIKLPSNFAPSFIAKQNAPIFKFRSIFLSLARHIIFAPIPANSSSTIRQFRIVFYLRNEPAYKTHVYDLPNRYSEPITFDFETDIVFDSMELDVVQNWGDIEKTYMNHFQIYGP